MVAGPYPSGRQRNPGMVIKTMCLSSSLQFSVFSKVSKLVNLKRQAAGAVE